MTAYLAGIAIIRCAEHQHADRLDGAARLTLAAMASFAAESDPPECFAAQSSIARRSGLSRRAVQYAQDRLAEIGAIEQVGRRGKTVRWRLLLCAPDAHKQADPAYAQEMRTSDTEPSAQEMRTRSAQEMRTKTSDNSLTITHTPGNGASAGATTRSRGWDIDRVVAATRARLCERDAALLDAFPVGTTLAAGMSTGWLTEPFDKLLTELGYLDEAGSPIAVRAKSLRSEIKSKCDAIDAWLDQAGDPPPVIDAGLAQHRRELDRAAAEAGRRAVDAERIYCDREDCPSRHQPHSHATPEQAAEMAAAARRSLANGRARREEPPS